MPRTLEVTGKKTQDPLKKVPSPTILSIQNSRNITVAGVRLGSADKGKCIAAAITSLGTPPNKEDLKKCLPLLKISCEAENTKLRAYLRHCGIRGVRQWKKDPLVERIIVECLGPWEDDERRPERKAQKHNSTRKAKNDHEHADDLGPLECDERRPERKAPKHNSNRKAKGDREHADELAKKIRHAGSHESSERKGQKSKKLPLFRNDEDE
ncbi:hypothetical protein B0H13DRAFT_2516331 [Mycena leptocephala]|nr:hypothetical protein B0H13DRAFT_2516331 [Mycena leptocephala]